MKFQQFQFMVKSCSANKSEIKQLNWDNLCLWSKDLFQIILEGNGNKVAMALYVFEMKQL